MKALIFIFTIFFSLNASAGDCLCKDKTGSSKRACKSSESECNSYCEEMNPGHLPGWLVTISYSEGNCESSPYFQAQARPANNWNDTGKVINAGESYSITVLGGKWYSNPHWNSDLGAGNSNYIASSSYLLPGAPEGALIGQVGSGPVFLIGNHAVTPKDSVGRLQVTVNDAPSGFGDNSGALSIDIKKQ